MVLQTRTKYQPQLVEWIYTEVRYRQEFFFVLVAAYSVSECCPTPNSHNPYIRRYDRYVIIQQSIHMKRSK